MAENQSVKQRPVLWIFVNAILLGMALAVYAIVVTEGFHAIWKIGSLVLVVLTMFMFVSSALQYIELRRARKERE